MQPPSSRLNVAMAAAQPKTKPAKANPKPSMKMHRRSRTGTHASERNSPPPRSDIDGVYIGCYTCRLRRKKCDEGTPSCTACRHLGLSCEYKRPMWWGNNEQRRRQKEGIKMIIKRTKLTDKTTTHVLPMDPDTPPGLSRSIPTSATFSDTMDRTRSASIDSQYTPDFDFNAPIGIADYTAFNAQPHSSHSQYAPLYPEYSPYEVDVKTERQMFVNDIPTHHESTISTFSTFHPPPGQAIHSSYPVDDLWQEDVYESRRDSLLEESLDTNFFDFSHGPPTMTRQVAIELNEGDRRLLDHFVAEVLPTVFPILEANQHGSARTDLILPALESNKCYLHCCLSISAQHLKATQGLEGEDIDSDIMRHRYSTISELCEALNRDEEHQKILEATLGMIFFQCSVGRFDDSLPDIPWHQHFSAAVSLIQKLDLQRLVTETGMSHVQTPFNMTLASWIDILGSTMQGRPPTFAHTYRDKHLAGTSLGLRELMGCDDRVMYLISEIACLEALKLDGMDDIQLCQHVHVLGDQIGLTEVGAAPATYAYNASGALSPKQLSRNITAAFRIAARIYLCSLVPGFSHVQESCTGLVAKLASTLEYIPLGPNGFDSSLIWVYLIGGSVSTPGSSFRALFEDRVAHLGGAAEFGNFGRVVFVLRELWRRSDGGAEDISWRDVMRQRGWDFLLI